MSFHRPSGRVIPFIALIGFPQFHLGGFRFTQRVSDFLFDAHYITVARALLLGDFLPFHPVHKLHILELLIEQAQRHIAFNPTKGFCRGNARKGRVGLEGHANAMQATPWPQGWRSLCCMRILSRSPLFMGRQP